MGTRGLWGFVKDGVTKATYNHYDSYPSSLGAAVLDFAKKHNVMDMKKVFDGIKMIDSDYKPTQEDIEKYSKFYDKDVNGGSLEDCYALLRETQGDPEVYFSGLDIMIDNADFIEDSLFCEWAYLINLDTECLEVYKGFQQTPPKKCRYYNGKKVKDDAYYPCDMIAEVQLRKLDTFDMESLEKKDE
jgi:hypothetical protein